MPNYTVRFDSLCGINIPQQLIKRGDKVIKPEGLYRENFELEGWYVSRDFSEDTRWSFAGYTVTSNMTLYANWTRLPTVGLYYFKLENENGYRVSVGNATTEEDILIASKYNGLPVTRINRSAFWNCDNLISITIPDSVTDIEDYAFDECSNLINIEIPNSVTNIGACAFSSCSSLTNIVIPDNVTRIRGNTFSFCTSLTSITISNYITDIEDFAFNHCNNLSIYLGYGYNPVAGWQSYWNNMSRPEITGCRLSLDRMYVAYIIKGNVNVLNPQNFTVNAPYRKGYTFGGWTKSSDSTVAEHAAEDIESVPYETKIYAIWIKN